MAEPAEHLTASMPSSLASDFAATVIATATMALERSVRTHFVRIAGAIIELRFASPVLERLFAPSFVERPASGVADMVVSLWDPASLPELPALPWDWSQYRACGEITSSADGAYVHIDVPTAALTVLDQSAGRAVYWCRVPAALPSYEFAGPLRSLLHRWAIGKGMALVHAGSIAASGRAALIIGDKGAGKSTTCLTCVAGGLDYLGDDRCILASGAVPQVHNVFACAKVFLNEIDRFGIPGLRESSLPPVTTDDKKALLYMGRVVPHRVPESAALKAIILPRPVAGPDSRLAPIAPATAMRHLIAEIVGRAPSTAARSLAILRSVCQRVPVYRLEAGSDPKSIVATVRAALES